MNDNMRVCVRVCMHVCVWKGEGSHLRPKAAPGPNIEFQNDLESNGAILEGMHVQFLS